MKYVIDTPQTIKEFLKGTPLSKAMIKRIKNNGDFLVNEKHQTVRYILQQGDVLEIILPQESTNIKPQEMSLNIVFEDDFTKYMDFKIKPNFKEAGKVLGSKMKDFVSFLDNLSDSEVRSIVSGNSITFDGMTIGNELLDVKIASKDGMKVSMENNNFIILNTTLNDDLIREGIAREIVSKVQNLRKEKGFDIENRIILYYNGSLDDVLDEFGDYIKKETLALEIVKDDDLKNEYKINDIVLYLDVKKVD